ncbi:hypothetical protein VNO77_25102 [Canavalia gladiata]|uniref:Uncharacterized protein n=1 Tax=Canavalia gladiata TaxID=3824 RepID=A0AAN9L8W1_CANGL
MASRAISVLSLVEKIRIDWDRGRIKPKFESGNKSGCRDGDRNEDEHEMSGTETGNVKPVLAPPCCHA